MPCSAGGYSTQLSFYSVKKENVNTFCKPWVTFLLFIYFFSAWKHPVPIKKRKKKLPVKRHSSQHFFCHFFFLVFLNADCKICVLLLSHWKKWVDRFCKNKDKDTHISWRFFKVDDEQDCRVKISDTSCVTQGFPLYLREESQKIHVHICSDFFVPK